MSLRFLVLSGLPNYCTLYLCLIVIFQTTCQTGFSFTDCNTHKSFLCVYSVSTDSHSQHGRPAFVHRDDRTSKTYERLQKKLKERQGVGGGGGQVKDSPPPSPQKTCSSPPTVDIHNGVGGKGLETEQGQFSHAVAGPDRQTGRGKNGETAGKEVKR